MIDELMIVQIESSALDIVETSQMCHQLSSIVMTLPPSGFIYLASLRSRRESILLYSRIVVASFEN